MRSRRRGRVRAPLSWRESGCEGRARFPVNLRYPRELRDDPEALGRMLVATPSGAQIPLAQLAAVQLLQGPAMLRNENGFLAGYVYVDVSGRDRESR